jgi:lipopolysaccharide cholinephosphotransferase
MPRPDFELFCKTFQSKRYKLLSPNNNNYFLAFAKICDCVDSKVIPHIPWGENLECGVWIDIFPIDGAPNDYRNYCISYQEIYKQWLRLFQERKAKKHYNYKKFQPKELIRKIIYINGLLLKKHVRNYNSIIKRITYGETNYCCQCSICTYGTKDYYPISYFNNYTTIIFENQNFNIIANYVQVLKQIYGNYMQLPPKEKRLSHSKDKFYFY